MPEAATPHAAFEATRLSALDASFIALERRGFPMNVGGVVVFDRNAAPPVTREMLRERLLARSQRLRRLGQRLYELPAGAGRPVWADDPHFDIDDHLSEVDVPPPGGLGQVERYVGEQHSLAFDLDKPLWHCTLLNGVEDGRVAVYMRFQHAFVDGLRGIALGAGIFDDPADTQQPAPSMAPRGERTVRPRLGTLLAEAAAEEGARVMRRAWEVTVDGIDPLATLRREARVLQGMLGFLDSPSPQTPLNGKVSTHRRMTFRELDRAALTATRKRHGVDHPSAVLAVVAGALARLFDARGQRCPVVRTLVPLANSRGSVYGNDAAFVLVDLPTGSLTPAERLRAIAQALATARATQLPASRALLRRWDDDSPISNELVAHVGSGDDSAGALVSFLRWPRPPPPLFGHPYRITYPTLPVGARLGLMVGVVEIGGRLAVGLASDPAILPEGQFFVVSMEQTLRALAAG
ncbi:MAG: DUF1298 domain-containing protein [Geodermatophilaceae bacterium]|nr:DUF1298 domain-containing protein [Geodermatophilaceae bacterium]